MNAAYNIEWQMEIAQETEIESLCIIKAASSKWIVNRRQQAIRIKLDWKSTVVGSRRQSSVERIPIKCHSRGREIEVLVDGIGD